MKWFYNLKLATKLISGFVLVAIIAGIIGLTGYIGLNQVVHDLHEITEVRLPSIESLLIISEAQTAVKVAERTLSKRGLTMEARNFQYQIMENAFKRADAAWAIYEPLPQSNEEAKEWNQFVALWNKWKEGVHNFITLSKESDSIGENDTDRYNEIFARLDKLTMEDNAKSFLDSEAVLLKVVEINEHLTEEIEQLADEQSSRAILILLIVLILGIISAIALGIFLSTIISNPIKKLTESAQKLAIGDVNVDVKAETKDEVGMLTESFANMVDNIKGQATVAQKISAGDVSVDVVPKSEVDVLGISMKQVVDVLRGLIAEAGMLSKAGVEGRLDTRGDAEKFKGGFKDIVSGVNDTLDAVIGPLNVAAEYIDRISKGDIPTKITDNYNGDFNEIKNNINMCIEAVNALVEDANMLTIAAVEGKLNSRADASRHGGDFARIVEGVNATLDAVIEPVKEASNVLQEMSRGNLKVNVTGNYKGDHAEIKNALNDTINTILGYVTEISAVLNEMANGNLDVGITDDYRGDFVEIKNSLNYIIDSFNEVLTDMNNTAGQVASGSRQVSDGSQALSQGSTEQASSIEELTASITEIASQTKQNAINANEANELANYARDDAAQGNNQMKSMLTSMSEINESSANISKIIKVIDEIAFQTNILALNAAVEAARAGQHGKGFAVVAEEVRNLAARSANAAKETTALIEGSIVKVGAGTKIANDTAEALNKIVGGVEKAANLVGEIANASNEQATGIAQINKGIEQVSQVVQTNSATAEESAAASEELSSQAEILKQMVAKFNMKKTSGKSKNYELATSNEVKYLENSSATKSAQVNQADKAKKSDIKHKIVLNDKEFGKY